MACVFELFPLEIYGYEPVLLAPILRDIPMTVSSVLTHSTADNEI